MVDPSQAGLQRNRQDWRRILDNGRSRVGTIIVADSIGGDMPKSVGGPNLQMRKK